MDPGFGAHSVEYIRRAFINGPEMVAFSNPLKPAGVVIVRGIPSALIRNGARIS